MMKVLVNVGILMFSLLYQYCSYKVCSMEKALATCLDKLFRSAQAGKVRYVAASNWRESLPLVPVFVLPSWHMNHVCAQLCEMLQTGALGNLQTLKLKVHVFKFITTFKFINIIATCRYHHQQQHYLYHCHKLY
jgi:hypothetical protein